MSGPDVRAVCVLALYAGIVVSGDAAHGQTRTRQAITGPVTREAVVRGLSVVPAGNPGDRVEASVMLHVQFSFDSVELTRATRRDLDRVAEALADARLADAAVMVEGHTDATGSAAYNLNLSQRRADAVVAYLIRRGIAGGRLRAVGHGEDRPLAAYAPADGRQRRVEIVRAF